MSRVQTSYYGAEAVTRFQWATTDNDLFDREFDLYYISQALEKHDHSAGRGLAVTRLADLSITSIMYGLQSIPTGALQDLSVTTGKIAVGAITDDRMANQKMNVSGGIFSENIRIQRASAAGQGYVYVGNGNNYFAGIDTTMFIFNNAGGQIYLVGDPWTYRPGNTATGFMFFGSGASIGYNGSTMLMNGFRMHSEQFDAPFPMGGVVWFRTNAELVSNGAHFSAETAPNGRLVVGTGAVFGATFVENTLYGTSWTPSSGLSVTAGSLAVSGITGGVDSNPGHIFLAALGGGAGSTNVGTADHVNPVSGGALSGAPTINGTGTQYLPPMLGVVYGRRTA